MPDSFSEPINATTRYCAVYGHPVKHSASPAFQNAGIARLGLNWRYLAFDVPPDQLREAIHGAQTMRFVGLNLTVPHKLLAVNIVDVLDESARQWGAVNTIRFEARDADGTWKPFVHFPGDIPGEIRSHGFNTDADGITLALKADLDFTPAGSRILLLGVGGAGRTTALKLASAGTGTLYLINRTYEKAEAVANEIQRLYPQTRCIIGYPEEPVDLVLNATSLGLKSQDALPWDTSKFELRHARAAYDMIYRPAETPFLRLAKESGCRTANGVSMLLHQGAKALEIWTDMKAPVETMREALIKNVYG